MGPEQIDDYKRLLHKVKKKGIQRVFGNLKEASPAAQEKVDTCIHQLLIREDFLENIIEMGTYHELVAKHGVLHELVDGKK